MEFFLLAMKKAEILTLEATACSPIVSRVFGLQAVRALAILDCNAS
jgi:hypothetical protein